MRRLLPLILLGAIALVIAACGGDDDDGGGSGETLTQEEWVAAADAICADANAELDALGTPESAEEAQQFLEDAGEIQERQINELRALGTPPELEERVNRAYDLLDEQLQVARDAGALLADGDIAGMQELLDSVEPIQAEADSIAVDVGLQECGADGDA